MQQKLKKIAIPTIYVLSVVAFGLSIYFIQLIVSNVVFQDPEPNLKYVDKDGEKIGSRKGNSVFLEDILNEANIEKYAQVFVLHTKANWYGVTYKEDKENVKKAIAKLIEDGVYPKNLWR